jgi:hypothetical protein
LVSDGNEFRRLRVVLKAGQGVENRVLAHGTPPSSYAGANFAAPPLLSCRRRATNLRLTPGNPSPA